MQKFIQYTNLKIKIGQILVLCLVRFCPCNFSVTSVIIDFRVIDHFCINRNFFLPIQNINISMRWTPKKRLQLIVMTILT